MIVSFFKFVQKSLQISNINDSVYTTVVSLGDRALASAVFGCGSTKSDDIVHSKPTYSILAH